MSLRPMYIEASRGDLDADTYLVLLDSLCPFKLLILIHVIMGAGDIDVAVASTNVRVDTCSSLHIQRSRSLLFSLPTAYPYPHPHPLPLPPPRYLEALGYRE